MISTELQHVQAHLNEILTNWQQWNSSYAAMETYLNEAFDRFEGMYYCFENSWIVQYIYSQSTEKL